MKTATEKRLALRAVLAGSKCIPPASVYDPLSARVAETVGYSLGLLSGSIVSATTLAAPDAMVHTATEFADQIRRITRASDLSLMVDADNGYGNALNVMRTIQEFEHSGVSLISIEDSPGVLAFGTSKSDKKLISIEENVGKLRAAIAARSDPSLIIAARTPSLKYEGMENLIKRARAYAAAGVDMIWAVTLEKIDQLKALQAAVKLPIVVGTDHGLLTREELAVHGARIALQGHLPVAAAVKALHEVYTHLFTGGAPADLTGKIASSQELKQLTRDDDYRRWIREWMS